MFDISNQSSFDQYSFCSCSFIMTVEAKAARPYLDSPRRKHKKVITGKISFTHKKVLKKKQEKQIKKPSGRKEIGRFVSKTLSLTSIYFYPSCKVRVFLSLCLKAIYFCKVNFSKTRKKKRK